MRYNGVLLREGGREVERGGGWDSKGPRGCRVFIHGDKS